MNKFDNIEDLFKEQFAEHTILPDANSWNQISDSLDGLLVEDMFKTKLSGHTITPGKNVWTAIAHQIGALSFWSTKTGVFIKSLGLVASLSALVFAGIWMLSSQENKANRRAIASYNYTNTRFVDSDTCKALKFTEPKALNNKLISNKDSRQTVSGRDAQFNSISKSIDSETKTLNYNNFATQDKQDHTVKQVEKLANKENLNQLFVNQANDNFSEQPQLSYIDTIRVVDTIVYYDTLRVEVTDDYLKNQSPWSINPYISFWGTNSKLECSQYFENYEAENKNALAPGVSTVYGLGVNYDFKKWRFGSGLSYHIIQEEFTYDTKDISIKTSIKYDLEESGFYDKVVKNLHYEIVTRQVIKVDTIASSYIVNKIEKPKYTIIDTVWSYKTDTTVINKKDSVEKFDYDTIRVATYDTSFYQATDTTIKINHYDNVNKYSYLEIPFHLSYGFKIKKLTIRPTIGLIVGIMINAKGYGISAKKPQTVYRLKDSELPFANLSISGMFGLGIEYQLNNHLSVYTQPFYRYNFNSIYQNTKPLQKRFYGMGLSLGVTYRFK